MLILGKTKDFRLPLLDEYRVYTVDGEYRLFTLPYEEYHMQHFDKLIAVTIPY